MNRYALPLATTVYVGAVVAANVLTAHYGQRHVWPGWSVQVTTGTYAAGAALLARDFVQRHATIHFGRRRGIAYVFALIGIAALISWATASAGLAIASGVAFAGAEVVDLLVFTPTQGRWGFAPAALASNIVSAPIDTVLFLWIAGFPLTWSAMTGQFIGKVFWATLIPLSLWALLHYRQLRALRAA